MFASIDGPGLAYSSIFDLMIPKALWPSLIPLHTTCEIRRVSVSGPSNFLGSKLRLLSNPQKLVPRAANISNPLAAAKMRLEEISHQATEVQSLTLRDIGEPLFSRILIAKSHSTV